MVSMNKVLLMGNVTRSPEIRKTPGGTPVLDLGVAVNENYKGRDGQTVQSTYFADVVVWGRQAENCVQYLGKGSPVMVEGRLHREQWKTKEGETRSRMRILAQRVQFLERRREGPSEELKTQDYPKRMLRAEKAPAQLTTR